MQPRDEAQLIIRALFDDFGTGGHCPRGCPYVDGKEAILEMKEKGWNWREVEWPGYYLKHKTRELTIKKFPDKFEEYTRGKLYLLKGTHLWDVRFNVVGPNTHLLPYMSPQNIDLLLEESNGLGLIVVNAIANLDLGNKFYDWHESLKGKTEYVKIREAEGRPSRVRKTAFMITRVDSYFFPDGSIHKGVDDGWIDPSFQSTARQADGGSREGKYLIRLSKIPSEFLLEVTNFNEDPDEWAAEFDML